MLLNIGRVMNGLQLHGKFVECEGKQAVAALHNVLMGFLLKP
jgi:hypothetical protein